MFLLIVSAVGLIVVEILWIESQVTIMGRFFFVAINPIALFLSAGLLRIIPIRYRNRGALYGSAFLLLMCLELLSLYWLPHY